MTTDKYTAAAIAKAKVRELTAKTFQRAGVTKKRVAEKFAALMEAKKTKAQYDKEAGWQYSMGLEDSATQFNAARAVAQMLGMIDADSSVDIQITTDKEAKGPTLPYDEFTEKEMTDYCTNGRIPQRYNH